MVVTSMALRSVWGSCGCQACQDADSFVAKRARTAVVQVPVVIDIEDETIAGTPGPTFRFSQYASYKESPLRLGGDGMPSARELHNPPNRPNTRPAAVAHKRIPHDKPEDYLKGFAESAFLSENAKLAAVGSEMDRCDRRADLSDILWGHCAVHCTFDELVSKALALLSWHSAMYIGATSSCIWRWVDCEGGNGGSMSAHCFKSYVAMYPLAVDSTPVISFLEKSLISKLKTIVPDKIRNSDTYIRGPLKGSSACFLYVCVER